MATKSKPVRIFADDDSALDVLAQLRRQSRAQVIHEALAEYLVSHRLGRSGMEAQVRQGVGGEMLEGRIAHLRSAQETRLS